MDARRDPPLAGRARFGVPSHRLDHYHQTIRLALGSLSQSGQIARGIDLDAIVLRRLADRDLLEQSR